MHTDVEPQQRWSKVPQSSSLDGDPPPAPKHYRGDTRSVENSWVHTNSEKTDLGNPSQEGDIYTMSESQVLRLSPQEITPDVRKWELQGRSSQLYFLRENKQAENN